MLIQYLKSVFIWVLSISISYNCFCQTQTKKTLVSSDLDIRKDLKKFWASCCVPFLGEEDNYSQILDSTICYVPLNESVFQNNVKTQNLIFGKRLDIDNSDFFDSVDFSNVHFHWFSIYNSIFYSRLFFDHAYFEEQAFIHDKSRFYDNVKFFICGFNDKLEFYGNTFFQDLVFEQCVIKRFELTENSFKKGLILRNDSISELDLIDVEIKEFLSLSGSYISKLRLPNRLPDTVDLSYSEIEGEIDFQGSWPREGKNVCYLNITNMDISKLNLDYSFFKLYFPKGSGDDITSIYRKLLSNLKTREYDDGYKILDIEYQKYKYKMKKQQWISWIQEKWWNYGYDKQLILRNTAVLFFIFFLINGLFFKHLLEAYAMKGVQFTKSKVSKTQPILNNWFSCLIYTFIVFFGIKLDTDRIDFSKKPFVLYLLLMYSSGLVCSGFILGYILNK